jgi:hypothetical protein
VTIDLSRGLNQPAIKRKKIDIAGVLELDKTSPNYESEIAQYNQSFMVDRVSPGSGNDVILHISSPGPYKVKELAVELPK